MEVLNGLALLLFLFVGYSLGAVLTTGRGKTVLPGLLDLAVILGMYVLALRFRHALGKWLAIGVVLIVGMLVSSVLAAARRERAAPRTIRAISQDVPTWRRLYNNWKLLASDMGNYQGRLLLTTFYFSVLAPWGLALRLLSDPLRIRPNTTPSHWVERSTASSDIDEARRMF